MSRKVFMHPTSHDDHSCGCLRIQQEIGIKWPEVPWDCLACKEKVGEQRFIYAYADPQLIRICKQIVEKGKLELEREGIQESHRKRVKITMNLAQDFADDPAEFLCVACHKKREKAKDAADALLNQLLSSLGVEMPA